MKYILNDYYILRHDASRTFILGGRNGRKNNGVSVDENWKSIIHPAYAMMLSFFSEAIEFDDAVVRIADFFSIPKEKIAQFLTHVVDAAECWHTTLCGFESGFPRNLVIPEQLMRNRPACYSPENFRFSEIDSKTRRMISAPLSIVWMPNNNCHTSCEYCYADRRHHTYMFSREEIESFVKDAKRSGIAEIMLTGGDFFENKHWREILEILQQEGYNIDMVSTKKPLSRNELEEFKVFGVRLQISFDTASDAIAKKLLHVSAGYTSKMKETLQMVDELGISFQVATVLTNLNDEQENLEELWCFLSGLHNIGHWEIRVAFRSLYSNADFNTIKSSREHIKAVANWIESKQEKSSFRILWSPDDDDKYKKSQGGSRFFEGPVCAANMTNMVVLPDGNVTICEQLYWNPEYIIGNVFTDTISLIWQSDKALQLWRRKQSSINAKSPCRTCRVFEDCFVNGNRCFANIIKAYGIENSDYPDWRCYLASAFKNKITHE